MLRDNLSELLIQLVLYLFVYQQTVKYLCYISPHVEISVVDIFQSKNLVRFGNTNKSEIKQFSLFLFYPTFISVAETRFFD